MSDARETGRGPVRIGFRASIIAVFIAAVLVVGLTLVYLSFRRVSSIPQMAASTFIDKVGQLGADRIALPGSPARIVARQGGRLARLARA